MAAMQDDLTVSLDAAGQHLGTLTVRTAFLVGVAGSNAMRYTYEARLVDGQTYSGYVEHDQGDAFGMLASIMLDLSHHQRHALQPL